MTTWKLSLGLLGCIILLALAGGCSPAPANTVQPDESALIRTTEFEGVILPQGDWLPSIEEVLTLEKHLASYLPQQQRAFDSLQAPIEQRLTSYKRQYWGILERDRRVIVANLFCDARHDDWLEREVIVLDGGDCYFRIEYDVATGTFTNLIVNGSA